MNVRTLCLPVILHASIACGGETGNGTATPAPEDTAEPMPAGAAGASAIDTTRPPGTIDESSPTESTEAPAYCDVLTAMDDEPSHDPGTPNSLYGRVIDQQPNRLGEPCEGLAGVEVCLFLTEQCTRSDEQGFYVLENLPEGEREITFVKQGHLPTLRQVTVPSGSLRMFGPSIVPQEHANRAAANAGRETDPSRGGLHVLVSAPAPSSAGEAPASSTAALRFPGGVEMHLSPVSAGGPFYVRGSADAEQRWAMDPALSVTAEGAGSALWLAIEPGDYSVEFVYGGMVLGPSGCVGHPHAGFGLDDMGRLRVRVRAGLFTGYAGLYCNSFDGS